MRREQLGELMAYAAVAEERSFTRAAARLGMTQSSLSHLVRRLEASLGVRLLSRTTRSVAPTEAGERLLRTLRPALDEIDREIASLSELRDKPAGSIRITTAEHAAQTILQPVLARFLPQYPDIHVEIVIDYGLTDVVAERFDAGIRLGEQVAKDMVAVRIGPSIRMAAVGSPVLFVDGRLPKVPQDLAHYPCINLRLPTAGGLYTWEFTRGGRDLKVRVEGQVTVNDVTTALRAARDGLGIAFVPDDLVREDLDAGRLVRVLADWCPPFPGYHLYYPSRRQPTPAFALLVEALRYRARPATPAGARKR
ncbi:MAG TPA: LysR substrate-binding domain-containing protein [Steroidobacteraceae bacterium]